MLGAMKLVAERDDLAEAGEKRAEHVPLRGELVRLAVVGETASRRRTAEPASGSISRAMRRRSVDLPAPFGATRAARSPSASENVTPSKSVSPP